MNGKRELHYTGTKLTEKKLSLQSFSGTEQLSQLFQYTLDFVSEDKEIKFADVVNQEITVSLDLPDDKKRYFNGLINRFVQTGGDADYAHYEATVVPKLWLLTRKADCRIYQRKDFPTIADVIFEVLEQNEISFEKRLDLSLYREWEFCVQYRETDFNFISRLMEQEGIYYFFEHSDGAHKLILCDSPGSHKIFEGYKTIPYRQGKTGLSAEGIYDWLIERELQTENFALGDFDFQNPTPVTRQAANEGDFVEGGSEIFDYPGEFTDEHRDDYKNNSKFGERYARLRAEEMRAQGEICEGSGDARGLATGYKFTLEGSPRGDEKVEYLIISSTYTIGTSAFEAGQEGVVETSFACNLTAIEASVQYRPACVTPKPAIQGPQTALVVGDGEIYTDKFGRVKVQFHWDRESKSDRDSSCWVRVAQIWAGAKWGGIFIPRVGQEVIVEFLEGDPDRPIITGRVYNKKNMPPYELPDKATMSTIKSYSSKGGGGFNEFRFEDKKGEEQIFIHGQKDMEIRIEERHRELIKKDCHIIVRGGRKEKVDKNQSLQVGQNQWEKVGQKHALEAGQEIHLKAGMKVIIEAGAQLSLIGAGGFIDIGPTGVTIQGNTVLINSGGAPGSGIGSSPENPEEAMDSPTP